MDRGRALARSALGPGIANLWRFSNDFGPNRPIFDKIEMSSERGARGFLMSLRTVHGS